MRRILLISFDNIINIGELKILLQRPIQFSRLDERNLENEVADPLNVLMVNSLLQRTVSRDQVCRFWERQRLGP